MRNPILFICAWILFGLACIGIVVPVLPTTPLLLAATFLFMKSSPRAHAWIVRTRVYDLYVRPFKEQGGIPFKRKLHILGMSYTVMAVSTALVQKPVVWGILAAVALFLLYLMCVRIPTVGEVPGAASRPAARAEREE